MASEKLSKDVVLYFSAADIASRSGARCGICIMFFPQSSCTAVKGAISGDKGVCGLYVNGPNAAKMLTPHLSKQTAGYSEEGPTHCGSCEYYGGGPEKGPCKIVEGEVEFHGCCNAWED
jgi:hypothetical protein